MTFVRVPLTTGMAALSHGSGSDAGPRAPPRFGFLMVERVTIVMLTVWANRSLLDQRQKKGSAFLSDAEAVDYLESCVQNPHPPPTPILTLTLHPHPHRHPQEAILRDPLESLARVLKEEAPTDHRVRDRLRSFGDGVRACVKHFGPASDYKAAPSRLPALLGAMQALLVLRRDDLAKVHGPARWAALLTYLLTCYRLTYLLNVHWPARWVTDRPVHTSHRSTGLLDGPPTGHPFTALTTRSERAVRLLRSWPHCAARAAPTLRQRTFSRSWRGIQDGVG